MSTKAEDDISEIKSDMEACRMNIHLNNSRQKDQKEKHEKLQEQVDNLKSQVDSFYKHYCDNLTEGGAAPVQMPVVMEAAAPAVDYSKDIERLNSMFDGHDERIKALEE